MILDGKAIAEALRARLKTEVCEWIASGSARSAPSLHVVLVGDDPASVVYTRNKERAARDVGMQSELHVLAKAATEAEVLACVTNLAGRADVDGILVQLPLPSHLNAAKVLSAIPPEKDVDGFHVQNAGKLSRGEGVLVPCTPKGCMHLLAVAMNVSRDKLSLAGKRAVVVGRSDIVGKPMALLLLQADATVTIAHSKTPDLAGVCREADILVAAVGRPEFLDERHVQPGAIVIDVGINRVERGGKSALVGDINYAKVASIAKAITPVPGGVGPMTIACLLENTLVAARHLRS
jgi:methylenetetrahydrofolate dehydrogenase (NADP+) / methenyltetrahydrofolate cyclohydrolase